MDAQVTWLEVSIVVTATGQDAHAFTFSEARTTRLITDIHANKNLAELRVSSSKPQSAYKGIPLGNLTTSRRLSHLSVFAHVFLC